MRRTLQRAPAAELLEGLSATIICRVKFADNRMQFVGHFGVRHGHKIFSCCKYLYRQSADAIP